MSREEAKILLTKESDDLAASCFSNSNSSKSTPLKSGLSAASDASKKQRDEFVMCIYEYWKAKRLKYVRHIFPNTNKIENNFLDTIKKNNLISQIYIL